MGGKVVFEQHVEDACLPAGRRAARVRQLIQRMRERADSPSEVFLGGENRAVMRKHNLDRTHKLYRVKLV